jgi:outer membrane lipoprotein SlyB
MHQNKEHSMRISRFSHIALGSALAASLAACAYNPPQYAPVGAYPGGGYPVAAAPMGTEYGRVSNIQFFQAGPAASGQNVPGAVIGAVAGALVGNMVGRSLGGVSARDTSTVLGGVGGAVIGSQAGRGAPGPATPVYRITVQSDQGVMRFFDVPSPGDLRIGDRVRVDNGVISHY